MVGRGSAGTPSSGPMVFIWFQPLHRALCVTVSKCVFVCALQVTNADCNDYACLEDPLLAMRDYCSTRNELFSSLALLFSNC